MRRADLVKVAKEYGIQEHVASLGLTDMMLVIDGERRRLAAGRLDLCVDRFATDEGFIESILEKYGQPEGEANAASENDSDETTEVPASDETDPANKARRTGIWPF